MALDYKYVTTTEEFLVALRDIRDYVEDPMWETKPLLAVDGETTGERLATRSTWRTDKLDVIKKVPMPICYEGDDPTGIMRTLQIGLNPIVKPKQEQPLGNKQYVFDLFFLDYNLVVDNLKPLTEKCNVLGHNVKYDFQFLYTQLGINLVHIIDTMLVSQVLLAGDPVNHGLDDSYKRFLDFNWFLVEAGMTFDEYIENKKENQTSDWSGELTDKQIKYAAEDVYFIFFVLEEQQEWIKDYIRVYESAAKPNQKILNIIKLENDLVPVYGLMELRGVPFDTHNQAEAILLLDRKQQEASDHLGFTTTIKKTKYAEWCTLKDRKVHMIGGKNKTSWEEEIVIPMNFRSPQQLAAKLNSIFQKDLGPEFLVTKKDKGKLKVTTEEDSVKEAYFRNEAKLSQDSKEKIHWILQYKKAAYLKSSFGQKLIEFTTLNGFIHPNWFQIGASDKAVDTGRSSSSKPNFQNIPARQELFPHSATGSITATELFRSSVAAKPGWKLVVADFSQIEPRIAAYFCGVEELIRRYKANTLDIHAWVAKIMLGLDEEPDKHSYERKYIGKTAGLSILYGKYWSTLKEWMFKKTDGKVNWTDQQAEDAWNKFFENAPEFRVALDNWNRQVKSKAERFHHSLSFAKQTEERGKIPYVVAKTLSGRPRRFTLKPEHFDLPDYCFDRDHVPCILCLKRDKKTNEVIESNYNIYKERLRAAKVEGFNHHIQGTAADIMKKAALYVHRELIEAGFDWKEGIVAVVHDEIVLHVREEHVEQSERILKQCMERAGSEVIDTLPILAEVGSGDNWATAKP